MVSGDALWVRFVGATLGLVSTPSGEAPHFLDPAYGTTRGGSWDLGGALRFLVGTWIRSFFRAGNN